MLASYICLIQFTTGLLLVPNINIDLSWGTVKQYAICVRLPNIVSLPGVVSWARPYRGPLGLSVLTQLRSSPNHWVSGPNYPQSNKSPKGSVISRKSSVRVIYLAVDIQWCELILALVIPGHVGERMKEGLGIWLVTRSLLLVRYGATLYPCAPRRHSENTQ